MCDKRRLMEVLEQKEAIVTGTLPAALIKP